MLLGVQLLTDLCCGTDLSQTTAFGAPSEDTPLSTKTDFQEITGGTEKSSISIVFN